MRARHRAPRACCRRPAQNRPGRRRARRPGRPRTGELARLDARRLIRGHARDEHDLLRALHAREHHHRRLQSVLQLIDRSAQRAGIGAFDLRGDDLHAVDVDRTGSQIHALAGGQAVLERAESRCSSWRIRSSASRTLSVTSSREPRRSSARSSSSASLCSTYSSAAWPGDRLDAPHARRRRRFRRGS